jgi:hypothetical protein
MISTPQRASVGGIAGGYAIGAARPCNRRDRRVELRNGRPAASRTAATCANAWAASASLASVETVIAERLETARDLGRPIPELKGRLPFA